MAMVDLPPLGFTPWLSCNSAVAKLHQNHFQDILENLKNLVELAKLNWVGGGGELCYAKN